MARAKTQELPPVEGGTSRSWFDDNLKAMSLGLQWVGALLSASRGEAAPAAAYQAARERMREGGAPAAIDRLSRLFHLSPFDEDVLLLALSAQLHGKPKQATAQVARSLFGLESDEALARLWERLASHAPLRRFQLIETSERPVSAATPLVLDERVGRYLMGEEVPDQRIAGIVTPV